MKNNKPQSLFLIIFIVTSSTCPNGYKKCAMQFSPFKNNVEIGNI